MVNSFAVFPLKKNPEGSASGRLKNLTNPVLHGCQEWLYCHALEKTVQLNFSNRILVLLAFGYFMLFRLQCFTFAKNSIFWIHSR